MDFATLVLIALTLYLLQTSIVMMGSRPSAPSDSTTQPTVSVIVATRNDESTVGPCIESLCRQTYPSGRYEVIVVDDDSTDRTPEIVRESMQAYGHVHLITLSAERRPGVGRRRLSEGIARASGEIVLVADVESRVPDSWVEATASLFEPDVGYVSGLSLPDASTSLGGVQSLDGAFLRVIAASRAPLSRTFGTIGKTFSARKEAIDKIGGDGPLPCTGGEHQTIVHVVRSSGRWQERHPINRRLLVEHEACRDLRSLFQEKLLWVHSIPDISLLSLLIVVVGWCAHLLPIVHLIVWSAWWHTLTVLFVKASADYLLLYRVLTRLGRLDDLRHFMRFELYLTVYVVALPIMVLAGTPARRKGPTD
jgi:glycosyltransferase involved in cell wall biosynthesis